MQTTTSGVLDALDISAGKRQLLPVEIHCHGFGALDFSDLTFDLGALDAACQAEGVIAIPTVFLHRDRLTDLERLVHDYHHRRENGELAHIAGIGLEGPLLASRGGTPTATTWLPTLAEWERLAALGAYGLAYTVLSPDAFTPRSALYSSASAAGPGFKTMIPLLVEHGVRPALGHFTRDDPWRSADQILEIIDLAWSAPFGGHGSRVITDHLFNDMPLNIRHAFRDDRARSERAGIIAGYHLPDWTLDNVAEIVGPVPAVMMQQAASGRIAACINFDGEHVDLEIARCAIELTGYGNAMIMTDRCDSARLGGQGLHHQRQNSLWYQADGIVAAGSRPLARQVANAQSAGLADDDIWQVIAGTAHRAFGLHAPSGSAAPVLGRPIITP